MKDSPNKVAQIECLQRKDTLGGILLNHECTKRKNIQ